MANDVVVTLSVNDLNSIKSIKALTSQLEAMKQKLKALQDASNGNMFNGMAARAAKELLGAAQAFIGVSGIVSGLQKVADVLKSELAEITRRQSEAGRTQVTTANVFAGALRNVGINPETGKANLSGPQLMEAASDIQSDVGVDMDHILSQLGVGFAGVGPSSTEEALKTVEAVKESLRAFPEIIGPEFESLVTAMTQSMAQFGFTAKEALGFLMQAGQVHVSKSVTEIAKNVMPAVILGKQYGQTPIQGMGAASWAARKLGDTEGSETANASWKMARELEERFPKSKGFKDWESRLDYLVKNKAIQPAFFEGGEILGKKFDKPEMGMSGLTLMRMLVENEQDRKDMFDSIKTMGQQAQWGATVNEVARNQKTSPFNQVAEVSRSMKSAVKQVKLADTAEGMAGTLRDNLKEVLAASNKGPIEQWRQELEFNLATNWGTGKNTTSEAINMIRNVEKQLERGRTTYVGTGGFAPGVTSVIEPTPAELEKSKRLKTLREQLENQLFKEPLTERIESMRGTIRSDKNITDSDARIYGNRLNEIETEINRTPDATTARLLMEQVKILRDLLTESKGGNRLIGEQNKKLEDMKRGQKQKPADAKPPIQPSARSKNFSLSQERDSKATVR